MDGETKQLRQQVSTLRNQLARKAAALETAEEFLRNKIAQASAAVVNLRSRVSAAESTLTLVVTRGNQLTARVSANETELDKLKNHTHVPL